MSPYLKSLSMVAANKLLHLLEAFSTTWFLFSAAQNHHLVFFLLEVFNNIIQYQFDGEAAAQARGLASGQEPVGSGRGYLPVSGLAALCPPARPVCTYCTRAVYQARCWVQGAQWRTR